MHNPTPPEILNRFITGYWTTQMVYVAAKLKLADILAASPKHVDDLATETNTHPPSLYRLLRALASLGIFAEDTQHRFTLTPLAECLRSDIPGSQHALAVMSGEEHYLGWGELLYSVQTGKTGFEKLYGMGVFDYLSKHEEQAKVFDAAMVSIHGRESEAMASAYDFSQFKTLADIGGGNGSLLTAILKRTPHLRGLLYDLPGVTERAKTSLQSMGVLDRVQVMGGSFFESIPPGADAYMMRHIIHDWDDERSLTILRNIHKVIPADGKLLVVEGVIPPGNDPNFGKLLDLTMLTLPGGKERTEEEYRTLFKQGGFELTRIVPTAAEVSVIEGRKV